MTTPSLLIVEDDEKARVLLTNVLKRAGYYVTAASDGETAIQLLSNATANPSEGYPYDVVITDIRMQGLDGIEVMHMAMKLTPPPAVILMTGYSSVETAVTALRAHAYDYLLKPCDTEDMLRCVDGAVRHRNNELRRAEAINLLTRGLDQLQQTDHQIAMSSQQPDFQNLSSTAGVTGRFFRVGDMIIDLFRHTATYQEQQLQLTPIEYELLRCLAQSAGQVLSYQTIAEQTHGSSVDTSEAQVLLRTHIRNLRRKINPDYIVNVRGTGYMLVVPEERGDGDEEEHGDGDEEEHGDGDEEERGDG